MDKMQSLTFLDKCLEKVNNSTKEEIARFKEIYDENQSELLESKDFDFCVPILTNIINEQIEKN